MRASVEPMDWRGVWLEHASLTLAQVQSRMTVTQLNPPLPLETPRGQGLAHFMIDYGPEHHLMWTVFIDATGECWTFQNPQIRAAKNVTLGRPSTSPIKPALDINSANADRPILDSPKHVVPVTPSATVARPQRPMNGAHD